MIDASPSLRAANGLTGPDVASYLLSKGWAARPSRVEGVSILSKDIAGCERPLELILPIAKGYDEERRRVADALRTIGGIERRSVASVADDIRQSKTKDSNAFERAGLKPVFEAFDQQLQLAMRWVDVVPQVSTHETRQVAEHLFMIFDQLNAVDVEEIALKQARVQRHISLAILDCIVVLNRFHFNFLEQFLRENLERNDATLNYVSGELARLRSKQFLVEVPATQEGGSLSEIEAERDKVGDISRVQEAITQDLTSLYNTVATRFGADRMREMLQEFRTQLSDKEKAKR